MSIEFPPRFLRLPLAAAYCGMGDTLFQQEVRPHVPAIRIGQRGIAFDRLDLDRFLDAYKQANLEPCFEPKGESVLPQTRNAGRTIH